MANKLFALLISFFCSIAFSMDENTPLYPASPDNQLFAAVKDFCNTQLDDESDEERDLSLIEKLLNEGANPNAVDSDGITPLAMACSDTSLKLVKMLVNRGANVNQSVKFPNGEYWSPLAIALCEEQKNIAKLLHIGGAVLSEADPAEAKKLLQDMQNPESKPCLIM